MIYSEDEREIGVWTDGKPLYQKTAFVTPGNTISMVGLSLKYAQCYSITTSSVIIPVPYNDGSYICWWMSSDAIRFATGRSDISQYVITYQYTKDSDFPGSGKWTPQGVPAVHYSENEQVVGTWVDGRAVYEKTITFNSPISGSVSITHNISNLDTVISANGAVHDNWDPATWIPHPRIASDGNNIGISNISNTTIVFYVPTVFSNRIHKGHIIIRYTKTTD